MKPIPILAASLLLACPGALRADTVELSGLASLFGEKMALLVVYPAAKAASLNFTLSEGQSQYGIKLVQVDPVNHQVEIEQDGIKKFIYLSGSPVFTGSAGQGLTGEAGAGVDPKVLAAYLNGNDEVERIKAGNPGVTFSGGGAKAGADNVNDTGTGAGAVLSSATTGGTADHSKEFWYQESLIIEQSRIATAQEVLAGDATPWPRTPLTPASTPAGLIGKETYYPNHILGYVVRGSVESLAAR